MSNIFIAVAIVASVFTAVYIVVGPVVTSGLQTVTNFI